MLLKIFKTAYKNITKNKIHSAINICGLSVGFTAYILINLYVNYENSWDKCHLNYSRIYRVQQIVNKKGEIWTQTPPAVADALTRQIPEIEQTALYRETWGLYLSVNNKQQFYDNNGAYTDTSYFNIFTYHFLKGDPKLSLQIPNSIMLEKTLARKLFGDTDPLGQTIIIGKKFNCTVTAIYDSLPENTSFNPDYFLNWDMFKKLTGWNEYRENWGSSSFRTLVLLKPGIQPLTVNKKIKNLYSTNNQERDFTFFLLPASDFYLNPLHRNDYTVALFTYSLVALFILILVIINFINYTIANTSVRAPEIAIRKINGCSKFNLFTIFLLESFLLVVFSLVIALLLADLSLPVFNRVIGKNLSFQFIGNTRFFAYTIFISAGVGFFSGIYPSLHLASVNTYDLLRGKLFIVSRNTLRKILVTFQLFISLSLIITSIIVAQQLNFMLKKDLGFEKDNLIYSIVFSSNKSGNYEDLRSRLLKNPIIQDACISKNIPFYWSDGKVVNWEGGLPTDKIDLRTNQVNYDYIRVMGMKLISGRDFSRDFPSDSGKSCIINETAVRTFGWKNPIGKSIDNGHWRVIGVVKDFHPYSIHEKIPPFLLELNPGNTYDTWIYTFKIVPGKLQEAEKFLSEEFGRFFPNDPFEFKTLSDTFLNEGTFKTYQTIRNTFFFFTLLTILLTIFGLLGLITFSIQRRIKEIGIRKINGGTVWDIFSLLNKEYLALLAIITPVSIAVNVYFYRFLPFNYRYGLHLGLFLSATGILVGVILLTTGYFTYKAATRNPSEILRYE